MKLTVLVGLGVMAIGLGACASNTDDGSAESSSQDLSAAQASWREAISAAPSTEEGCFHASYPSMKWEAIDCGAAPTHFVNHPPASAASAERPMTVGNGNDYAAQSKGTISKTVGTFPTVTGVKTESDDGQSNGYSIQLNSNFMKGTKACKNVSGCQSWSQFVYSSEEQSAFIQDWLIGIGTCPSSAWNDAGSGDCYKNSAAVNVPVIPITKLSTMKMSGSATSSKDSLVFTADGEAYSTSQADSVTNLSTAWTSSEFNIIGDGGGSAATFNKGSSVTVKIAITDGTNSTPTCLGNGGTTGETNNLTAGKCTTGAGFVQFTETK